MKILLVASILGIPFFAALGVFKMAGDVTADRPVEMRLESLSFDGERFNQSIEVSGRRSIRGEWSAKITRGDRWLCGGSGGGVYTGRVVSLAPDEWTGSSCPPLAAGDVASAAWQWTDRDGLTRGISGELVLD